jgi:hypothetical protein
MLGSSYNLGNRIATIAGSSGTAASSGDSIQYGKVTDVKLDDSRPFLDEVGNELPIGSIKYIPLDFKGDVRGPEKGALPLNLGIKQYPLKNEVVSLFQSPTSDIQSNVSEKAVYYKDIVNLWGSPNHNAIPDPGYNKDKYLGAGFQELFDVNPLFPFPGDTLIEGRQGQSIRIGGSSAILNPLVDKTNNGLPYILISNGQIKTTNGIDYIIEDINKDANSLYFLSNHKAPLSASNAKRAAYTTPPKTADQYKGNQVILNAGRVYLNAKEESALISAKDSVGLNANTVNLDGKEYACIDADKIYIGVKARTSPQGVAEPAILGNQLDNFLSVVLDALQNIGEAMKTAEAQTGGPIASLNTEGYCVVDTCTTLRTLVNQMKSKKVFIE